MRKITVAAWRPAETLQSASLAKCSQDTALRDIRELVDYQILIQPPEGGRNTSYQLAVQADQ